VTITGGDEYTFSSDWVVMSRNDGFLRQPEVSENLVPHDLFAERYDIRLWTDQFCDLFEIVKHR
jgi:hypothetical protein